MTRCPAESTLRITDADDAVGRGVVARRSFLASNGGFGLIGDLVASGVGGDEHASVMEVDQSAVADDLNSLTG
jgi:hypothetical protein